MLNQEKKECVLASISSAQELNQWKNRCQQALDPHFNSWHPDRQKSYLAGRKALSIMLTIYDLDPSALEIINSHRLKMSEDYLVSISHTQHFGAAFVQKSSNELLSVGIDLELANRKVRAEVIDYVSHPNDPIKLEDRLEHWCKKEAAFKAISSFLGRPKGLNMSQIWVKSDEFGMEPSSPLGRVNQTCQMQFGESFYVATARLTTIPKHPL